MLYEIADRTTVPEIKGFIKSTLIDWEGRVASIIWLGGCNFRCPFCYATELVLNPAKLPTTSFEEVEHFLKEKKDWIDGLVICGGEPTIHSGLPELIQKFKKIPVAIKLDTNGTNPDMLKSLLEEELIDYVAMDLKAPLDAPQYDRLAGVKVDLEKIKQSIDILINGKIDYEFRTTVCPAFLDKDDILKMAQLINGANRYVLQEFKPGECFDPEMNKLDSYPISELKTMAKEAKKFAANTYVRGESREEIE
ncbi:MAG: anaerobic ribonucleoside-triphosphate reductase activating protein [Candidatus Omnitrophota bacterium]|nr:anaerobic ribonucleoside-triphosphate reductase activating protein [Candidatus Omnitrophota bacterium]